MDRFKELKKILVYLEDDFSKFYGEKKIKAAGVRIRKGLQELKNKAQEIRKEIIEKKNENQGN